jgi:hypothetical protein
LNQNKPIAITEDILFNCCFSQNLIEFIVKHGQLKSYLGLCLKNFVESIEVFKETHSFPEPWLGDIGLYKLQIKAGKSKV